MQIAENKTMATFIALFLVLTIAVTLFALPTVNAAVTYYSSFIYIGASPNVVGVDQQLLLLTWTAAIPPDIGETAGAVPGGRAAWYGITMVVTKPDNTTENLTLTKTDPVGGGYLAYTPLVVGTYYVQAFFPETWKNTTANQAWYSSAVSAKVAFTVQQEPIQPWQETPLPTQFWTRPINNANRDWDVLAGNWLTGAAQNVGPTTGFGYGTGPESAHILWTRPFYAGGIMDERLGNIGFRSGDGYQGVVFGDPIIINGHLIVVNRNTAHTFSGWWVIDLYTGETLSFENDTTIPAFGQLYDYESPNQHGGFEYLWRTSGVTINNPGGINGTVWELLDGFTLQSITKIANVTSGGTAVYGKDGSILRYNVVNLGTTAAPNYYLQVWNSSAIPSLLLGTSGTNAWQWRPADRAFHDGSKGFSLNKSISSILGPRNAIVNQTGSIQAVREDQYVIIGAAGQNDERGVAPGFMMAFNLKPDSNGVINPTKLWDMTFTPPQGSQASNVTISLTAVDPEDGVILFSSKETMQRWGYSLETGQQLWEGEPEPQFNYYNQFARIYQGMLLSTGWGGVLIAYNITTGKQVWNYSATNIGFESPYGGNYPMGFGAIADGKILVASNEHSITQPMWRGPNLRCINASNGAELWKILFSAAGLSLTPTIIIADGIIIGLNYYDMQIYAFGKGPSATTVEAPTLAVTAGSSAIIRGTVTDQCAGAKKIAEKVGFTNGVPAVSDESQEAWMEWLYEQQGKPTNATGVEVSLDAVDPNGNYVHIGTATSDENGLFSYQWTAPDVPGKYTIIATFAGSAAYYSSYAETATIVSEAPPATAPPEYPQPIDNTLTIVYATIAIIVAIAIVGLMLVRMLRKRP
jgi:hypothetical protein